jgi:hypothetical protein
MKSAQKRKAAKFPVFKFKNIDFFRKKIVKSEHRVCAEFGTHCFGEFSYIFFSYSLNIEIHN